MQNTMNESHRLKSTVLFLALGISLTHFLATTGLAGDKPEHTIKWATIAPESTVWGDAANEFSKTVAERTNGKVKNVWYFGAVMGDEPDVIRKMRLDQLQGSAILSVGLAKLAPDILAYSLPFLFDNYEEVDCTFEKTMPELEEAFRKRGYEVFGRGDVGFSVLFSKNNIRNVEDFKKAKSWTWSGLDVDKAGAMIYGIENLIPLPLPEVLTALQTGMVDTAYATYYTAIALQWHTQIDYMSDVEKHGGAYAPSMLVLNKKTYDSLPREYQKVMKEEASRIFPPLRKLLRKDEASAREALLKRGIKLMDISPGVVKDVRENKSRILYKDWEGKYVPAPFLKAVIKARDECRIELNQ